MRRPSPTARSRRRWSQTTAGTGSGRTRTTCGKPAPGCAADANVFNERGLPCANLANGMVDIHTPDERIAAEDLERMVDVTLAIVDAAREPVEA